MNGSDDSEKDEIVGYGRPPVATRFQKGKSGNPKGRPKGRKGVGNMILDALHRKVDVREGDRVRSMPKIQAAIEVALNKACKGDLRAFTKVIDVATKLGIVELPPSEREIYKTDNDADSALEYLMQQLDRLAQANIEDVKDNDAAPGCKPEPEKS